MQNFPILTVRGAQLFLQAFQESQQQQQQQSSMVSSSSSASSSLVMASQAVDVSEMDVLYNLLLISRFVIDKVSWKQEEEEEEEEEEW